MEDRRPWGISSPFAFAVALSSFAIVQAFPGSALAAEACSPGFTGMTYSAKFQYEWGKRKQNLRVQFGRTKDAAGSHEAARIVSAAGACQASCTVSSWVKTSTAEPVSAELLCHAPGFEALATTVTVYWVHPRFDQPAIRFGKWLDGYEETKLRVEVDHVTPKRIAQR